jgi:hypothetical protein
LTSYSRPGEILTSSATGGEPGPDTTPASPSAGQRGPLADPVAEARRLIDAGRGQGLTVRAVGGVAVHMQSPASGPLLPRTLKDIDLVVGRGDGKHVARLLAEGGYVGDEMFNALRGDRRQLFHDPVNARQLDVFVGAFSMCHSLPIADRLDRDPYTVPLAELLMTKLQVVELNERDERDIYTLCYHHDVGIGPDCGIESDVIGSLCAGDWGLWRTCQGTIERCCADLDGYDLDDSVCEVIESRLRRLSEEMNAAPKTGRWKRRSRVGERMRWYQEPEEV